MPRSRNIAFLGPAFPYRGGIAHVLESMVGGLRRKGHLVNVFTFSRQYPALLFPGHSQLETSTVEESETDSIRILDSVNPISWWKTARRISDSGAEILVLKYWTPYLAPAFGMIVRLLRRNGIPTLVVVHNAIPHESKPGFKYLSRFVLSACDAAMVMSESVENDLRTLNVHIPVTRVYHPVYDHFGESVSTVEARTRLAIPKDASVVLFFGFIRKYKGLDILLEAWPTVQAAIPEAMLVIAGEFYQEEKEIRSVLSDESRYHNVRLLDGYIPTEQVADLFGAADVVVQPYRSATQSGVAQIAYHFERPVITTDVGGLAEIVPNGISGLVVKPEDPDGLAESIVSFFQMNLAETLTNGVREQKRKYGWDPIIKVVEDFSP